MVFTGQLIDELIRPGDEIYVRISSADEQATALTAEAQRKINPNFMSYTVNEEGAVKLPLLKRVSKMRLIN